MRLLVVSHTPHYVWEGEPWGWEATVRELSALAGICDELIHVAPAAAGKPDGGMARYEAANVRLRGVQPSGGRGFLSKAAVLAAWGEYLRVIRRELKGADAVHVRCPCNIGLLAVLVLMLVKKPERRWIKYAGNWRPEGKEPWSYRLQRWLLRKPWHRAVVTVNGEWPGDPPHVRAFLNPSFTRAELEEARAAGRAKSLSAPVRLVFAGRVEEAKGAGRAVEVVMRLRKAGVDAELFVAGDGPLRQALERRVKEAGLEAKIRFGGWMPRKAVGRLFGGAHFCLLPSRTEGWAKVLGEAMAWGAVPVAGAVGSILQILGRCGCGVALEPADVKGFAEAVLEYVRAPERWKRESEAGMAAAEWFTYEAHVERVGAVFGILGHGLCRCGDEEL